MIGIGVIGYGYWGPNLVRNFAESAARAVASCATGAPERLALVERALSRRRGRPPTPRELIADPAVDAVAIATPVRPHFELAMRALRAGKHVLVEKPMASTSERGGTAHRRGGARAGWC